MPRKNREKLDILQVGGKCKYSDLCHILQEQQLRGNQKQAQISRWQCNYLFEKIFIKPLDKQYCLCYNIMGH